MLRDGAHLLNIDHHHDNTRFGTLNYVVPRASCTAEIVWDLMHGLGVDARRRRSREALYIGLVTDTGRFMYENTGPRAHQMAAELIEAGVDVQTIYRRLYEELPLRQARAAGAARSRRCSASTRGELTLAALSAEDFERDRGRGELLGGHHRPAARGAGHEGRGARARADRGRSAAASAKSRCARPTTTSTCR